MAVNACNPSTQRLRQEDLKCGASLGYTVKYLKLKKKNGFEEHPE
jgi:hypothetical protein